MAFLRSLDIAGSALTAERYRSDIILQNIANARTTRAADGSGPYKRQQVVFEERPLSFLDHYRHYCVRDRNNKSAGVKVQQQVDSINAFKPVYDPTHPDADADGYVWYPNVDTTEEMTDLMAASNAYDANLTALNVVKAMIAKSLEISR